MNHLVESHSYLFLSNRLEVLSDFLRDQLFFSTINTLFEKRYVIVPNHKIKQYLSMRFAQDPLLGIVFGIQFLSLSELYQQLTEDKLPSLVKLSLEIESELLKTENDPLFTELATYLGGKSIKRRIALSEALSQLFYQHRLHGGELKEAWHQELYRRIFPAKAPQETGQNLYHFFGFTEIPQLYQKALSTQLQIHYLLSPCRLFWEDLCSEKEKAYFYQKNQEKSCDAFEEKTLDQNPLLANMGKSGRRALSSLNKAGAFIVAEKYLSSNPTLLGTLQNDLLELQPGSKREEDPSIICHPASSLFQEVQLLIQWMIDKRLNAQDVRVYAPSIHLYAPAIELICQEQGINYTIQDLPLSYKSSFVASFLELIDLPNKDFSSKACVKLFYMMPFLEKSGFLRADLLLFERWITLGCISSDWEMGFSRLLNALLSSNSSFLIDFTDTEKLSSFIKLISNLKKDLAPLYNKTKKSVSEWLAHITLLAESYFSPSEEQKNFIQTVNHLALSYSTVDSPLTFFSVQRILESIFDKKSKTIHAHNLDALVFSSLYPGSALPSKAIALLGMTETAYPKEQKAFLGGAKIPYSTFDEEQYLFLELLLSARENLLIVYQNVSNEDGERVSASPLVLDLLSYLGIEEKKREVPPFIRSSKANKQTFFSPSSISVSFPEQISLKDLKEFARHPVRWYCKTILRLQLDELEVDELALSPLKKFILKKEALKAPIEKVLFDAQLEGSFPKGPFGELFSQKVEEEVEKFKKGLAQFNLKAEQLSTVTLGRDLPPLRVTLNDGAKVSLVGQLSYLSDEGFVFDGEESLADQVSSLPLFLTYLNLQEAKNPTLLFLKSGTKKTFQIDAKQKLADYLLYYKKAHTEMPIHMPDWIEALVLEDAPQLKKAIVSSLKSPFVDPYLNLLGSEDAEVFYNRWNRELKELCNFLIS